MDPMIAVMYYFNEVIRPVVEENGNQVKVPIMYANPERCSLLKNQVIWLIEIRNENYLL